MKKFLVLILSVVTLSAYSQTGSVARDSVAQTGPFQRSVKMASLKAANNILADPAQSTVVRQYAQLVVSDPMGSEWLNALSFGTMTNPSVNYDSSDADIEFTVNSLFAKYAYAYYRVQQP